jgi:membrane-associated protease RseP (regulator of RpoE activity)
MRRFQALLVAAGLAAAPASAAAGPDSHDTFVERFEWSTGKSRLGVLVNGLTPELRAHFGAPADRGLLVARVEPGSPAAKAGIAVGDVLLEVGGTPIDRASDVLEALSATSGKPVAVAVIRDRKRTTIDVTPTPTKTTAAPPSPLWELMRKMFPNLPTTTT